MRKKVPLIAVSVCCLALAMASSTSLFWSSGSLEDALAKAKSSGKLLLLDFFQEYG